MMHYVDGQVSARSYLALLIDSCEKKTSNTTEGSVRRDQKIFARHGASVGADPGGETESDYEFFLAA